MKRMEGQKEEREGSGRVGRRERHEEGDGSLADASAALVQVNARRRTVHVATSHSAREQPGQQLPSASSRYSD
jgi:hypothetical protein